MADKTKIEWTDATWNIITGCSVISPGCTNCYAMKLAGTRLKNHESRKGLTRGSKAGPVWTGEVRFNEQWLTQPLRWKRPRRIFVCAHGDLFAEGVSDEWLDCIFAVMALSPQHTFQVLTKRPERMREYLTAGQTFDNVFTAMIRVREETGCPSAREQCFRHGLPWNQPTSRDDWWPLSNVWLGVSVEDQTRADERIPVLLDTPAALRWISAEPLLGPIDIAWALSRNPLEIGTGFLARGHFSPGAEMLRPLEWIVAGGESGPDARPMHPDWARSLRDQCAAAGVPFSFKQWGEWEHNPRSHPILGRRISSRSNKVISATFSDGTIMNKVGKTRAGRLLDGVLHDAFPEAQP